MGGVDGDLVGGSGVRWRVSGMDRLARCLCFEGYSTLRKTRERIHRCGYKAI
jgi:hypothetical protein